MYFYIFQPEDMLNLCLNFSGSRSKFYCSSAYSLNMLINVMLLHRKECITVGKKKMGRSQENYRSEVATGGVL